MSRASGPSPFATALEAVKGFVSRLGVPFVDAGDDPTLTPDEAIRRAHALGVAAAFGADTDDALAAVKASLDATYDRSIVDLAYREGRGDAEGHDGEGLTDEAAERLRDELAEPAGAAGQPSGDAGGEGLPSPVDGDAPGGDLPTALQRAGLLDGGADLGALGFPEGVGEPNDRKGPNS
ncbi:hypothetical protein [Halobaculum litoreum]|uniref:Uncharacterized protein n=1 Tax=Halobaculum litoreum TaxID=3031998 RepID=A0ABD5XQ49_9EURY|nr:hypothetical protein [Halobaculum sp. DT92]